MNKFIHTRYNSLKKARREVREMDKKLDGTVFLVIAVAVIGLMLVGILAQFEKISRLETKLDAIYSVMEHQVDVMPRVIIDIIGKE